MRTVLVISVALVFVVACLQAADAKPKYTIPESPPDERKPSGTAAVIRGGGRRLLETNTVVSSPNTDEKDDHNRRTFFTPNSRPLDYNSPPA
ncbi:hypothetical protein TIFTF001_051304 [Ficus carica]|uniref:Secreted protein n=1 Tax=Ficus carica TaxID=3494 RepID=A0AA88D0D1_FICCA|nr:hypothetical protein TIFTF001_051304 [Ficus carica]